MIHAADRYRNLDFACPDVVELDSIALCASIGDHSAVCVPGERRSLCAGPNCRKAMLASDCIGIDHKNPFVTGLGRKRAFPRSVRAGYAARKCGDTECHTRFDVASLRL
jgi:hypothetical protein